jgi:hypothetical protein
VKGKLDGVTADADRQKDACDKHFNAHITDKLLK